MSEIPMNERNIVFFPVQSVQIGMDENDNPIYDNAADAEILQNLRQLEIKDGVYPDNSTYLQVMSNNNMTVTVKAGYAHVRGVQVWVKEDITLALVAADDLTDRTDRVVLRLSLQDRDVTLAVKTGDATLTRTEGQTWELGLADIAVDHLNDTITQAEITDLRLDTTACGMVSGLMQVDTQSIFNQYMTWWEDQRDTTGYLTVTRENPSLNTTDKTVLGAINELDSVKLSTAGENLSLNTTDKTVLGAINELDFVKLSTAGENPSLDTADKTVLGAINELKDTKLQYVRDLYLDDLNNITEPGFYSCTGSSNATIARHYPMDNMGGLLQVNTAAGGAHVWQIYFTREAGIHVRWFGGVWYAWYRLLEVNDVVDSLLSTATNRPLSAARGKYLYDYKAPKASPTFSGTSSFTGNVVLSSGKLLSLSTNVNITGGLSGVEVLILRGGSANAISMRSDYGVRIRNSSDSTFAPILASAFTVNSSYRWKDNINPFKEEEAKKLLEIEPKTFTYKPEVTDDGKQIHMGVIAEEIVKLYPDAVIMDKEGLPEGVDYSKLVVPCIGMIQQQQKEIDSLKAAVAELKEKVMKG